LSSGGGLRAWFITLVRGSFATWAEYLAITATNLFWATVYVILTALLITFALFFRSGNRACASQVIVWSYLLSTNAFAIFLSLALAWSPH
jgi:hypothetical protein